MWAQYETYINTSQTIRHELLKHCHIAIFLYARPDDVYFLGVVKITASRSKEEDEQDAEEEHSDTGREMYPDNRDE